MAGHAVFSTVHTARIGAIGRSCGQRLSAVDRRFHRCRIDQPISP
jgi:hypothetical protein